MRWRRSEEEAAEWLRDFEARGFAVRLGELWSPTELAQRIPDFALGVEA